VFPALAALLFSALFGTTGAWLFFVTGEIVTLLGIGLLIRRKTGKQPWKDGAFLLQEKEAGAQDHLLETEIHSLEETEAFVKAAEQFCLSLGENAQTANHIALCIEEISVNVVKHGFTADEKPHHLAVRLLGREDAWVLRFRDDCTAFDPVGYVPAGEGESIGLRLVLAIAEKAFYTYSLNMNNLTLRLGRGNAAE
jgi:anti-sigma regulatory factor (Ser/Thr protein kinase)